MSLLVAKGMNNSGQDGLLATIMTKYVEETAAASVVEPSQNDYADINSLTALSSQNTSQAGQQATSNLDSSTIQEDSLMAGNASATDLINSFKANQVVEYSVQSGDSIGLIASNFGVSINTIIWANNLKNPNSLTLGQVLKIPPVTGVIHTVRNGDTVASIAKKYKADADKVLSFNNLTPDQALETGNELIVPDGALPEPLPPVKVKVKSIALGSGASGVYVPVGNGQCVDFVQAHGFSNLKGNAYQWKKYLNTPVPVVGGVVVFRGGRYGHVAIVTAVKEGSVQVVEQNYYGHYVVDHREISLGDRSVVGFIR